MFSPKSFLKTLWVVPHSWNKPLESSYSKIEGCIFKIAPLIGLTTTPSKTHKLNAYLLSRASKINCLLNSAICLPFSKLNITNNWQIWQICPRIRPNEIFPCSFQIALDCAWRLKLVLKTRKTNISTVRRPRSLQEYNGNQHL